MDRWSRTSYLLRSRTSMYELGKVGKCCVHCQGDVGQMEFVGCRGHVMCSTHARRVGPGLPS
eukprot:12058357-Karenia_brevis.AAC.1